MNPEDAAGRGQPRPRGPAPSRSPRRRGPRRAAEAGKAAPLPAPLQAGGRSGPYLSPGAGYGCDAAREGPERSSPAGSSPGRRARGAEGGLGPGSPARRAGLDAAAPGAAAGRSVTPMSLGAAAETAGTGPQEEPQPERQAAEAEEGRGHSVYDPLTRKQLWSRWRALRDGLVPQPPAAHRL